MQTPPRSSALLTLVALFLLLAGGVGCARSAPPDSSSHAASAPAAGGALAAGAAAADPHSEGSAPPLAAEGRSLVVTMDMSITVDHVGDALARARAAAEGAGGFVADSSTSGSKSEERARLELRVPAARTSSLRGALGELGEITSSSEKIDDVTEQRADLEARLHNARVQEKRVLEIMAGRASSVRELLEAEKELARIRESIERLEAQERVTKSKVELATVRVALSTRSVPAWETPGPSIARAGKAGVRAAAATAVYAGMAFVTVAPTLAPVLALAAAVILVVRRRRARTLAALLG